MIGTDIDYQKIWDKAKDILKEKIPASTYEPWILPIEAVKPNEEQYKEDYFILKSDQSFGAEVGRLQKAA